LRGWRLENAGIPSKDTSAYCQARKRLSEKLLQRLFSTITQNLEKKTTPEYLWCDRHVKVIDGSKVSMPDTDEKQTAYPLMQKPRSKLRH